MSLDQIFMLMADKKVLKGLSNRTQSCSGAEAAAMVKIDDHGRMAGRAADGTPIKGRMTGRSKAQMIRDKAQVAEKKRLRDEKRRLKKRQRKR